MAGASVSKIILVFKHMGLAVYTSQTFFYHQNKFIFPTILNHWESYQAKLIESLRTITDTVWCGDGRFDSMGHSAKYGVYTMFCTTIMKIVHFDLLQVSMKYIAFVEGNCMLPPSKASVSTQMSQ
jgi:solute carrier family 8 (sodium/calcium exchanger)